MSAIRSPHSRVFEQLILVHRRTLEDAIIGGIAADYPAYRQLVGQIQGMNDAVRLSEEADFKLSGEEPDAGS